MDCPSCRAPNLDAAATCRSCGRELARRSVGPGSVIASRYELLAELGVGGMGTVFRAQDRSLDEVVALKLLRSDLSADPGMAQRFRSEVKLAWRVRDRNVCGIHEYGEDGDVLYISMELVEGRDLKAILRDQGPLAWEDAYDVALQTAEGLLAIHEAGVIHRDLKPANITRDASGLVRLMDFGIAKAFGQGGVKDVTRTGQVVGSPEYMSPEQWRGQELDFRSDIYALGVAIFEMFTGHPPFQGESPAAVMVKHLQAPAPLEGPEASRIPPALVPVLRKALAKDPADRYGTCREMLTALRAAHGALGSQLTDDHGPPAAAPDDDEPTHLVDRARLAAVASGPGPPAPVKRGPSAHSRHARLLVPALTRALSHERPAVRAGAAQALARIGPEASSAAAAALSAAASDTDTDVRNAAAMALSRVAPERGPADGDAAGTRRPPPVGGHVHEAGTIPPAVPPPPPPVVARAPAEPQRRPPAPASAPRPSRSRPRRWSLVLLTMLVAAAAYLVLARRAAAPRVALESTRAPTPVAAPPTTEPAPPTESAAPLPTAPPPSTQASAPSPSPPRTPSPRPSAAVASPRAAPLETTPHVMTPSPPPAETRMPEPTPEPVATPRPEEPAAVVATPAPQPSARDVIVQPQCESCPPPPYPLIAQRLGIRGRVRLRLSLSDSGAVSRIDVIEGPRELAEGVVKAVRKWRYRPATRNGAPMPFQVEVPFDFQQ